MKQQTAKEIKPIQGFFMILFTIANFVFLILTFRHSLFWIFGFVISCVCLLFAYGIKRWRTEMKQWWTPKSVAWSLMVTCLFAVAFASLAWSIIEAEKEISDFSPLWGFFGFVVAGLVIFVLVKLRGREGMVGVNINPQSAITADGVIKLCRLFMAKYGPTKTMNANIVFEVLVTVPNISRPLKTTVSTRISGPRMPPKPPFQPGDSVRVMYDSMNPKFCKIVYE